MFRLQDISSIIYFLLLFQIVNICSNDGQRIFEVFAIGPLLIGGPFILLLGIVYTVFLIGPWALVGSATYLAFYPFMVKPFHPANSSFSLFHQFIQLMFYPIVLYCHSLDKWKKRERFFHFCIQSFFIHLKSQHQYSLINWFDVEKIYSKTRLLRIPGDLPF